jgi:hypothetical protein
MRKQKIEDESIKGMLKDEYNRCLELIGQVQLSIDSYPRGNLVIKKLKIMGRVYEYHHLQWREGEKVVSWHVPEKDIPEIQKKIEQREAYRSNCQKLEKRLEYLAPLVGEKKPSKRNRAAVKVNLVSVEMKPPIKNQHSTVRKSRKFEKG